MQRKTRSTPATMSKLHCRILQCRMLLRHCCQKRQQCRTSFALKFRPFDKVERCFDNVGQNGNIVEATGKVACCFDNVASTLLLVWTGLNSPGAARDGGPVVSRPVLLCLRHQTQYIVNIHYLMYLVTLVKLSSFSLLPAL